MAGTPLVEKRTLMDEAEMARALGRLATEIAAGGIEDLALIGIRTGGVHLAERLDKLISEAAGAEVPSGIVDITLYRDDVFEGLEKPEVGATQFWSREGLLDFVNGIGRNTVGARAKPLAAAFERHHLGDATFLTRPGHAAS